MANTRFKTHHGVYSTANSFIDGKLEVTGDLVVDGNVAFSGTSQGDLKPDTDQRNLGNTTYRWNLIGFSANLASTLSVNGAVSVNNTINVVNASTLQNTLTVVGWVNTAANLVVGGSANISGQVNVAGNAAIVGIATANGNTSFTNGLLTVNTNGGTSANTLTVGAANLSVDSGVLFVDAINNRVGINNTAPGVALRVTGAVDISSTANVQGNANVGGTFGVAGITTLSGNAVLSGAVQTISGNAAFDGSTFFVDGFNNKVGIGTTAPEATLDIRSDASNLAIGTISVSTNGFVANSSSIRVGNSSVNLVSVPGSITIQTESTQSFINSSSVNAVTYLAGAINSTSNGFLANSSSVRVGNSSLNVVVLPSLISVGNSTQNTWISVGDVTVRSLGPEITFVDVNADTLLHSNTVDIIYNDGTFRFFSNPPGGSGNTRITFDMSGGQHVFGTNSTHKVLINSNDGIIQTFNSSLDVGGILPGSNTSASLLGADLNRWHLYASNGNFSDTVASNNVAIVTQLTINTISVSTNGFLSNSSSVIVGNTSVNVVANTSSLTIQNGSTQSFINASSANVLTYLAGAISVSSNGLLANSSTLTLGNTTVAVSINTSSVNVSTYLSGAITISSNGFLANSSSIRVGNTSTNTVITASSVRTGNGTQNTYIGPGEIYLYDGIPNIIFAEDGAPTAGNVEIAVQDNYLNYNWIPSGGSSNTKVAFDMIYGDAVFGSNSTHRILAESQYGRITTRGNVSGQEGGIRPHSNTDGHFLGGDLNRWYLFANTGNFSNNIIIGTRLQANSSNGTAGQVLLSGGPSGNVYWGSASIFNSDLTINDTSPAITFNDTNDSTATTNSMYMQFASGNYNLIQTDDGDGSTNTRFTFAMSTGNLTIDGELAAASDERKKDNIVTVDGALGLVDSMRGVYFTRKGSDEKHVGVIAQEIQKVLPEVVSEDQEGYLAVSYGNIVGVLIEAIKELKREIEELKNGNKG